MLKRAWRYFLDESTLSPFSPFGLVPWLCVAVLVFGLLVEHFEL